MKSDETERTLQQLAMDTWGFHPQLAKLVEEAIEAAHAAIKVAQDKAPPSALISEIIGFQSVAASLHSSLGDEQEWAVEKKYQEDKLREHLLKAGVVVPP